ncbi:Oidioi.mRNA.OKI2018_I69.chr1.g879.t1.cds [Oikopleura dioica]|uniref:Oidioi.mRNA.OKI2018_I69.chr1.g879.t1.cds n=1 Tax=Oikopleura dioica TaxID=34765 RepID=A0ABN7SVH9_OIKDI|nr:Oidioi.mRNA.OKI2018_I69.chr1.g879.t1.cds [Oikopleura dioica]
MFHEIRAAMSISQSVKSDDASSTSSDLTSSDISDLGNLDLSHLTLSDEAPRGRKIVRTHRKLSRSKAIYARPLRQCNSDVTCSSSSTSSSKFLSRLNLEDLELIEPKQQKTNASSRSLQFEPVLEACLE